MFVALDRCGSVTTNANLNDIVFLSDTIPNRVGTVIVGRVLENKDVYNQLEDPDGNLHLIRRGDIVAGALGSRKALLGHSGEVPDQIAVGDRLHILNLGGVIGLATSSSPEVGPALTIEVLGTPSKDGVAANIEQGSVRPSHFLRQMPPVVAFTGTCMHSGKTQATSSFIAGAMKQGLNVVGLKLTGVALQRDVRKMKSNGAANVYTFNDAGLPSTCGVNPLQAAIGCLNQAATHNPDLIVVEFGDGLLGEYGVDIILNDPQISSAITTVILAAPDPVAAWGGVQILSKWGLDTALVTGQATDNETGIHAVRRHTGVIGVNARNNPDEFVEAILHHTLPSVFKQRMRA